MNKNNFTLLEVIAAMAILSIGVTALLWRLAISNSQMLMSFDEWERTHDLIQSAEYLLLHGDDRQVDPAILSGNFQTRAEYAEIPEISEEAAAGGLKLRKLTIRLYDGETRQVDELAVDCWRE